MSGKVAGFKSRPPAWRRRRCLNTCSNVTSRLKERAAAAGAAGGIVRSGGCGAGAGARRSRVRLLVFLFGFRGRLCFFLVRLRLGAFVAEIGDVPAAAFQLKACGGKQLVERRFAALRAV